VTDTPSAAEQVLGSIAKPIAAETRQSRSATKATSDLLLEMIEQLGLEPGDRLPVERDLALQLGISRSTVREAIRTLSSMGVLTARQGSGTYVTELSAKRLATPLIFAVERSATSSSALMDVRGMLEIGATEFATKRATKRDVQRLKRLAAGIHYDQDGIANLAADRKFHHAIHELSGNQLLVELIDSVWYLGATLRERIMEGEDILARTLAAHDAIVAGIASGDPQQAAAAMHGHMEDIRGWLQRAIEKRESLANGQSNT